MSEFSARDAARALIAATPTACGEINSFSKATLTIRGGRVGSGMGSLLEALWGYYVNQQLSNAKNGPVPCEIAWLADHEYNDFAVIERDAAWNSATRVGELLRIEAKSMNNQADESKGHFDEIVEQLGDFDLLLLLVWSWSPADKLRVYPRLVDYFIGLARPIARLRDELHIARGGSFVDRNKCPDKCKPSMCTHHGEPLNASGKRERLSGPESCRPSAKVSFAANFGGLVRMLKTNSPEARTTFRAIRARDQEAHQYISFIHRNYPSEERNQYMTDEWRTLGRMLAIRGQSPEPETLLNQIREQAPNYMDALRKFT